MAKYNWDNWEDRDLYDQGRLDGSRGFHPDYSQDKHSDLSEPYFDGYNEGERQREEERREAEFEEESQRLREFQIEQKNAEWERQRDLEEQEEFDRDRCEQRDDIDG